MGTSPLIKISFTALYCGALVRHCCHITAAAAPYYPCLPRKAHYSFYFSVSADSMWVSEDMFTGWLSERSTKLRSHKFFRRMQFFLDYCNHQCFLALFVIKKSFNTTVSQLMKRFTQSPSVDTTMTTTIFLEMLNGCQCWSVVPNYSIIVHKHSWLVDA